MEKIEPIKKLITNIVLFHVYDLCDNYIIYYGTYKPMDNS